MEPSECPNDNCPLKAVSTKPAFTVNLGHIYVDNPPSNHAQEHWLKVQADLAVERALQPEPANAEFLINCLRGRVLELKVKHETYYTRDHALRIAALALRIAAMAHREDVQG